MTSIIARAYSPKPPVPSLRIERHLADILARELALSLARALLVQLDAIPEIAFTCKLSAYKHAVNLVITTTNKHRFSMLTLLEGLPTTSYRTNNTVIVGEVNEPHVHITFLPVPINS